MLLCYRGDLGLKPFGESPSIIDLLVAYFRTKFLRNVELFLTILNSQENMWSAHSK